MLMASRIGNKNGQTENRGGLFGHKYKHDQITFNVISKTVAHIMERLTKQVS